MTRTVRPTRRWSFVAVGAAVTALAISNGWSAALAQSTPSFGSYTISATAPGFEMWEDEP